MNTTVLLNTAATKVWGTSPIYLGMSTTAPNINGTGATEPVVSGNGYARIQITNLSAPTNGVITNTKELSFPRILKSSGKVTYFTIYDSATVGSGNLLAFIKIPDAEQIQLIPRTVVNIEPNGIKLNVTNPTT